MPPSSASWSSVSTSSTLGLRAAPTSLRQEPSSSSSSSAGERPCRGQAADTSRMASALRGDRERPTDTDCAQAGRVRLSSLDESREPGQGRGRQSRDGRPGAGPGEPRRASGRWAVGWMDRARTARCPGGASHQSCFWFRRKDYRGLGMIRVQSAPLPSGEKGRICCGHRSAGG